MKERREPRFTADRSQMQEGTSKAVIGWQDKLSMPATQHRAGSAKDVSTRQQKPGS